MQENINTIKAEDFLEFRKNYQPKKINKRKALKLAKEVGKIVERYEKEHCISSESYR